MLPKYDNFIHPVLETLKDGEEHSLSEIRDRIRSYFSLTDEDIQEQVKSRTQTKFYNRIQWATTYLKKAELLVRPKSGVCKITEKGKEWLSLGVPITIQYLREHSIPFQEFMVTNHTTEKPSSSKSDVVEEETPEDSIIRNVAILNRDLAEDLLLKIKENTPFFFEQLVLDLLVKMGYGGQFENNAFVTKKTGDEGIDGVITEDKLGLEKICVQAKRYDDSPVGREAIQKFAGALLGQGVKKGIFITTSTFTKGALEFKPFSDVRIVLIDGLQLCNYMIEYNLGVATKDVYEIKRLDSDYFDQK